MPGKTANVQDVADYGTVQNDAFGSNMSVPLSEVGSAMFTSAACKTNMFPPAARALPPFRKEETNVLTLTERDS